MKQNFSSSTRLRSAALVAGLFSCAGFGVLHAAPPSQPNVIFILADDLGYGDLGCYGQKHIQTPNIDRMAAEGIRFRQFYAGSTVCAPSRCVLMTGKNLGHATVRGNAGPEASGAQMLRNEDVTVAEMLKGAGYATGLIGKWGLGMPGDEGIPNKQGFDYFFGYLSQHHAHNYFPDFLWRNEGKVTLSNVVKPIGEAGGGYATHRVEYSANLFGEEALAFIDKNKSKPFFLYLALTTPHANNERTRELGDGQEVPDYGIYADKDWPNPDKGQAAMITLMDGQVGTLLERLRKDGIAENTLVTFSSDNGPHREGGNNPEFFDANGPLRGIKRDLTDGGIRVPFIAWWPGRIEAGRVSDHVAYFGDVMATLSDVTGARLPDEQLDSISFAPTLFGKDAEQKKHDYLYWEFYEKGARQAVLLEGRWKGIRTYGTDKMELYDVTADIGEEKDVAAEHPELVERIAKIMKEAHTPNEHWSLDKAAAAAKAKAKGKGKAKAAK